VRQDSSREMECVESVADTDINSSVSLIDIGLLLLLLETVSVIRELIGEMYVEKSTRPN